MSFKDLKIIKFFDTNDIFVIDGYILYNNSYKRNANDTSIPTLKVGGCYQNGNTIKQFNELSDHGTIIGANLLTNVSDSIIYNYPQCLIPGFFPSIGGKYKIDQPDYDLQNVLDNPKKISKILGTGTGEISTFRVSKVCRSGIGNLSFNNGLDTREVGLTNSNSGLILILSFLNYSNSIRSIKSPESDVSSSEYMQNFDWESEFGVSNLNGSNTFPFFGWGGSRLGTNQPRNFQFLQSSLYNFPSFSLSQTKFYNPIGVVYAGQGVQLNTYPIATLDRKLTFIERNNKTYQIPISNSFEEIRQLSTVPYQAGRGNYEYFTNQVRYNKSNGLVELSLVNALIGAEGAIPGRNNAFLGVSLTDYWSKTLNLNNVNAGSNTNTSTRSFPNSTNKAAHNSPLCYIPEDESTNTDTPLPWNPLFAYTGEISSANSSGKNSGNVHVLKEGITTMVVSGAYPAYRGAWADLWGGVTGKGPFGNFIKGNGSIFLDQYYTSPEFWAPIYTDPATPQLQAIGQVPPIPPNPPFRIKGGRIVLYKGQRVKTGSYVYATINTCGNVTMPQFIPPGSKEVILNSGEQDQITSDIYSMYQSNQGGLIVMISVDGEDPPMPPSSAVPVGIILETIEGFGEPNSFNDEINDNLEYSPRYGGITLPRNPLQTMPGSGGPDPEDEYFGEFINPWTQLDTTHEDVNHVQNREILIRFFPMTPTMNLSGVSTNWLYFVIAYTDNSLNCVTGNLNITAFGDTEGETGSFQPVMTKIKTNYYLPPTNIRFAGDSYSTIFGIDDSQIAQPGNWGFYGKQTRNDYPYFP